MATDRKSSFGDIPNRHGSKISTGQQNEGMFYRACVFAGKRIQPTCQTTLGNYPHGPLGNVGFGSDELLLPPSD
jgi:hypothetical protein